MHADNQHKKRLFGNEGTLGLFVALYLILLTFFILLNSMSQHAAIRAAAAMDSVNATFSHPRQLKNDPTIDPSASQVASQDRALSVIQQAFVASMNLEGRFGSMGGNTFEVQFPAGQLFQRGAFRVRPDMTGFLDQLVEGVQRAPTGKHQQIAILFGSGSEQVDREMTRAQEVAIRRAGSLARHLRRSGVADGVFVTGFTAIPEGEILAVFWSAPSNSKEGVS